MSYVSISDVAAEKFSALNFKIWSARSVDPGTSHVKRSRPGQAGHYIYMKVLTTRDKSSERARDLIYEQ